MTPVVAGSCVFFGRRKRKLGFDENRIGDEFIFSLPYLVQKILAFQSVFHIARKSETRVVMNLKILVIQDNEFIFMPDRCWNMGTGKENKKYKKAHYPILALALR